MLQILFIWLSVASGAMAQLLFGCPNLWLMNNNRCYLFASTAPLAYDDAKKECAKHHASLLSVETLAEHNFVSANIRREYAIRGEWYTSGERLMNDNRFNYMWSSTSMPFTTVQDAMWLQPHYRYRGNSFVVVYRYEGARYGFDVISDPEEKRSYICEISQLEAYKINQPERGFDYGLNTFDANTVPRGPKWVAVPRDTFIVGETPMAYLECIAIGYPQPNYVWKRNNSLEVISPIEDSRYTITNGRLTIQDPSETVDAGIYQCEATNDIGTILGPPVQLSFASLGEFSNVDVATVTPKEYEGAVIVCPDINSKFAGAIRYQWLRWKKDTAASSAITSTNEFIRPELNKYIFISGNGKLYFSEVTSADNGEYSCIATLTTPSGDQNYVGASQLPSRTSKPIKLQVVTQAGGTYDPRIQDSFVNVVPGQPLARSTVTLECFAYGTGPLTYTWTVPNFDTSRMTYSDSNRVLTIRDVRLDDSGTYSCRVERQKTAAWDRSEYYLQVQSKPHFLVELEDQHIDVNTQQLTWRCEAEGLPYPTYTWLKDGQAMESSVDNRVTVNRNTLVIKNVDKALDEGMYQCLANNSNGASVTSAQLRVLSFEPSFAKHPMPEITIGAIGGNVTIPCTVEAAPLPQYEWTFNGGGVSAENILPNGDLKLVNLNSGSRGRYTCTVTNNIGSASGFTDLQLFDGISLYRYPGNTDVQVGNTAFLYCAASYNERNGDIDLAYIWKFNGRTVDVDRDPYLEWGQGEDRGGLRIKYALFEHEGYYTCMAATQIDSKEETAFVRVLGAPSQPGGTVARLAVVGGSTGVQNPGPRDVVFRWTDPVKTRGRPIAFYLIQVSNNYSRTWQNFSRDCFSENPSPMCGVCQRFPGSEECVYEYNYISVAETLEDPNTGRRQYTIRNLSPGTGYMFRVAAVNDYGRGNFSDPTVWVTIPAEAPIKAPPNAGGGGGKVGTLRITWDPLPPEDANGFGLGYVVRYRLKPGQLVGVNTKWQEVTVGNVSEYSVTVGRNLFYTLYEVKVAAKNVIGTGPFAENDTVYSAEDMPVGIPSNVYVEAFNESALTVYWDPVSDSRLVMKGKLKGYKVNYWLKDVEDETRAIQAIFWGQRDSGRIIGLEPDTWYTVNVIVFNGAGNGLKSEVAHQVCDRAAPLSYPVEVKVHAHGLNSVRVTFRGCSTTQFEEPLLGYMMKWWQETDDVRNAETLDVQKNTEGIIYGLQRETLYNLRVFGYSGGGDGQMSSPVTLFTLCCGGVPVDATTTEQRYLTIGDNPDSAASLSYWMTVILAALLIHLIL